MSSKYMKRYSNRLVDKKINVSDRNNDHIMVHLGYKI